MLSENDILVWQEHYRDLVREAEQERMARQVLGPRKAMWFHGRAVGRLVRFLSASACYLQRRDAFGVFDGKAVAAPAMAAMASDSGCV